MFACQFGRYRLMRLPLRVVPAGDMMVISNTDDILIVGYDANNRKHGRTPRQITQIYHQDNLKTK